MRPFAWRSWLRRRTHKRGPPTAQDAKMCRLLAYENYPQQRPGKAAGSGARYQFYRDCLARRAGSEPPPPAPEKPR